MQTKGMLGLRRDFLKQGSALAVGLALSPVKSVLAWTDSPFEGKKLPRAFLTLIDPLPDAPIAPGLIGLSYETLQMQNPDFFSADNHALVGMLRVSTRMGFCASAGIPATSRYGRNITARFLPMRTSRACCSSGRM